MKFRNLENINLNIFLNRYLYNLLQTTLLSLNIAHKKVFSNAMIYFYIQNKSNNAIIFPSNMVVCLTRKVSYHNFFFRFKTKLKCKTFKFLTNVWNKSILYYMYTRYTWIINPIQLFIYRRSTSVSQLKAFGNWFCIRRYLLFQKHLITNMIGFRLGFKCFSV